MPGGLRFLGQGQLMQEAAGSAAGAPPRAGSGTQEAMPAGGGTAGSTDLRYNPLAVAQYMSRLEHLLPLTFQGVRCAVHMVQTVPECFTFRQWQTVPPWLS